MESTIRWNAFQRVRETRAILAGRVHVLNILQHPFSPDNLCVFFRKINNRSTCKETLWKYATTMKFGGREGKAIEFLYVFRKMTRNMRFDTKFGMFEYFWLMSDGKKGHLQPRQFWKYNVLKFVIIKKRKIVIKYFIEKGLKYLETFLANRIVQLQ